MKLFVYFFTCESVGRRRGGCSRALVGCNFILKGESRVTVLIDSGFFVLKWGGRCGAARRGDFVGWFFLLT